MPMSKEFLARLQAVLPDIVKRFGTPFHIYDEAGIRQSGAELLEAFSEVNQRGGFDEMYAVKANPNPAILNIVRDMGFGFDCSSPPELHLARLVGSPPEKIMFTSNNTSPEDFEAAMSNGGCILNLDDLSLIGKVPEPFPELFCARYNPGPKRQLQSVIGNPADCKYGIPDEQFVQAYELAMERGASRFGIHTMVVSNELDYRCMVETIWMLVEVIKRLHDELGIQFEFINIGGGFGIPYRPNQWPFAPFDMRSVGIAAFDALTHLCQDIGQSQMPKLLIESGRWLVGPHGVLVTGAINRMKKYHQFIGVDAACTASMMRPAMYRNPDNSLAGYHEITVLDSGGQPVTDRPTETVSVVGPVCEDIDRFCWDRDLPQIIEGDLVVIHDTGAHCQAMRSNYNNRLTPKELLLRSDGSVDMIARAETEADLFNRYLWRTADCLIP